MKIKPNKLHLRIGLLFLPFLLLSTLTGFFRANHTWFWKEDYMKVKRSLYDNRLKQPTVTIDSVFKKAEDYFHKDVEVEQVKLKMEAGNLFYELKVKNEHSLLIDGLTGAYSSPISEDLVRKISLQYIQRDLAIKNIELIKNYIPRKIKQIRPVYLISYKDDLNTKLFIDIYTGEIVEELDDNLNFGMWMVKLHDYDFWDMKRFNLSVVALGILAIGMSGCYVWWVRKRKQLKKNVKVKNILNK